MHDDAMERSPTKFGIHKFSIQTMLVMTSYGSLQFTFLLCAATDTAPYPILLFAISGISQLAASYGVLHFAACGKLQILALRGFRQVADSCTSLVPTGSGSCTLRLPAS